MANQPPVRIEGTTEAVGDLLISCFGTVSGTHSITLNMDVPITSRPMVSSVGGSSIPTEAALLVNDCTGAGSCTPRPIQGLLQAGALKFTGITFPSSGSSQIRITNLRVNATSMVPGAFITGSVTGSFPIDNSSDLVFGVPVSTISAAIRTPLLGFASCGSRTTTITNLTIRELWSTAFKAPASAAGNATPGGWYQFQTNNESQTVLTSVSGWTNQIAGATPGQADTATRVRVSLSGIPGGVTVTMPATITSGTSTLAINAGGDVGTFTPVPGSGVDLTGSGSVTYEVRSANAGSAEDFNVPMTISSQGAASLGTILVSVTYAPNSGAQIPRFVDTSLAAPIFNISACDVTPAKLVFFSQPSGSIAGVSLPPLKVYVTDNAGALTSANVPVTLTSQPASISMTVNSVNGVATFDNSHSERPGPTH